MCCRSQDFVLPVFLCVVPKMPTVVAARPTCSLVRVGESGRISGRIKSGGQDASVTKT